MKCCSFDDGVGEHNGVGSVMISGIFARQDDSFDKMISFDKSLNLDIHISPHYIVSFYIRHCLTLQ